MRNPNTGIVEHVPINGDGTVRIISTEVKNIEPPSANMISQAENLIKTSLQNTNPKLWQAISNGKMTTKDRGYNVECVFMKNWEGDDDNCNAEEDYKDALSVCDHLDIPLRLSLIHI